IPYPVQVIFASMIWLGWLNKNKAQVGQWRDNLAEVYQSQTQINNLFQKLMSIKDLDAFAAQMKQQQDYLLSLCQSTTK
ncbi:MAG: hypothetical protein U1C49_02650, partial [Candidatus Andersenbacteria bacterium]|nr:hypothetical protein [Candidatus Andersenbacteria bacterium]